MVCDRCIKVVKDELEKLDLKVKEIRLGEVIIESEKPVNHNKLQEILSPLGFDLLEDKTVRIIDRIKTLIIEMIHYGKELKSGENISDFLAREIGKDYNSLSSLFSGIENITIEKFVILQKIEKVKEFLFYNELTLSEIAYKLGYSSVAHLSSQFKQVTGMTPSEFKKSKGNLRKPLDQV